MILRPEFPDRRLRTWAFAYNEKMPDCQTCKQPPTKAYCRDLGGYLLYWCGKCDQAVRR